MWPAHIWHRTLQLMAVGLLLAHVPSDAGESQQYQVTQSDPSRLTTQALQREIASLKEIILTRMDEAAKAIILLQQRVDREPQISVVQAQLFALREVMMERFGAVEIRLSGVDRQFYERDRQIEVVSKTNESAINAALQAQKESVAAANEAFSEATRKAEASTKERLDQLTALFQTETKGLAVQIASINKATDDKIAALTSRLGLIEGSGLGQSTARQTQDTSTSVLLTIGGMVLTIVIAGVMVAMAFRAQSRPRSP